MSLEKQIINLSLKTKKYNDLYEIPWKLFKNQPCKRKCGKGINIVILNTPCNGFGDLMFAHKLANFLRNDYGAKVNIATTHPEKLTLLGEQKENIIALKTRSNEIECRRFKYLDNKGLKIKYDLLFVAPVNQDYDVNHTDVKYLVNYSNKFNTFFFSEYNDWYDKDFDFPTGVGKDYYGLLLTNPKVKPIKRPFPYAFSYIAGGIGHSHIPLWRKCIVHFIQLVCKKHHKEKVFEIIGTLDTLSYVSRISKDRLKKLFGKFFGNIKYIDKNSSKVTNIGKKGNLLILNAGVLPVPNDVMLSLIKYSVKDVLLTGDQSITDGLSCCPDKNIWYQSVPWKYDFVQSLAKNMPNKYLKSEKNSCGSLNTTKFNSNYKKFIKENDFRKNAKEKLNGIILAAKELKKKNSPLSKFEKKVMSTKGLRKFKKDLLD